MRAFWNIYLDIYWEHVHIFWGNTLENSSLKTYLILNGVCVCETINRCRQNTVIPGIHSCKIDLVKMHCNLLYLESSWIYWPQLSKMTKLVLRQHYSSVSGVNYVAVCTWHCHHQSALYLGGSFAQEYYYCVDRCFLFLVFIHAPMHKHSSHCHSAGSIHSSTATQWRQPAITAPTIKLAWFCFRSAWSLHVQLPTWEYFCHFACLGLPPIFERRDTKNKINLLNHTCRTNPVLHYCVCRFFF